MLVRFGVEAIGADWPGGVVCIGTFDGVHRGHQEVIGQAVSAAREQELPAVVVTFDRHPAATLAPDRCPPAVGTLGLNLDEFARLGVSAAVVLPFDHTLASTSAEDFYSHFLQGKLQAREIVIGHDFAFGHGRQGNAAWLAERIDTDVVPPFELEGERISSSVVRRALAAGDVETARKLLGRPWVQEGVVVSGQKLGRTLGFPTLNLAGVAPQVVPANGVYAGMAHTPEGAFRAAIAIGVRPAVGGGPRTIEAFLLDYPGRSLYGAAVRLHYLRRLREERNFDSLEALRSQMELDVAAASRAE